MSQFFIDSNAIPGSSINTLSAEGGAATPPDGNNFDFSGANPGAILFSIVSDGHMQAAVQVDNSTIEINASNQLAVIGGLVGTVTTNDLETETVLTIPTNPNSVVTVEARVSGYGVPNGAGVVGGIGGTITGSFINGGSNVSQLDTADITLNSSLGTDVTVSASTTGSDILIQVTGEAGFDINWKCEARITEVS